MLLCKYPSYSLLIILTKSSANTRMMMAYKSATIRNVFSLIKTGRGQNSITGAVDVKSLRSINIQVDGAPFYGR